MSSRSSIVEPSRNPFGANFKQYLFRSDALTSAIMSMSAAYMEKMTYAWHYRAAALSFMQRDLRRQSYSVEMLAAMLFLGATECWFDAANSGSLHLRAASKVIIHIVKSGTKVPVFLTNFLCWFGTLASYVSDNDGQILSSSTTYALLTRGTPCSARKRSYTDIDPLVGNWGSLMPLVARVGIIVRQLRRGAHESELEKLIDRVETGLLEWGGLDETYLSEQSLCGGSSANGLTGHDYIAEAYRLSSLLALYSFCPGLLRKRVAMLRDGESTFDFLSRLANSIIVLLRRISVESPLWRVCSLPILSAGQLITKPSDRDFLRSVTNILKGKIRVPIILSVRKLLEDIWCRRDAGSDAWWMDILDESGTPVLIN
ncbi:hypothetical protein PV08_03748 [Exophiala spinifera]|uniref:Uncharacterized protein n=1 Tax=Exophiala spinifera TaxID=91928 RepID=A0A0D2BD94_9EURO|nr:uncharacterized protein PV08_03748 [Exophiala spinifera]KIW16560.1 hypothetical protein PV08_03748 [Exophiala spinifera]